MRTVFYLRGAGVLPRLLSSSEQKDQFNAQPTKSLHKILFDIHHHGGSQCHWTDCWMSFWVEDKIGLWSTLFIIWTLRFPSKRILPIIYIPQYTLGFGLPS
ncbi:hypothetical protein ABKN59_007050 [Abortiporus biennis]